MGAVTNEELERMTEAELNAWVEANDEGPDEDAAGSRQRPRMVPITIRMPQDMLEELKVEAAKHGHRYQRYARALMLLGLRTVQAGKSDPVPTQVHLSAEQVRELAENGCVTLQLRAS